MKKLPRKNRAQSQAKPREFSADELKKDILGEAKILGLPDTVAEFIADKTTKQLEEWVKKRPVVTEEDLNRQIAKALKSYNADLAYVYQNRGKII